MIMRVLASISLVACLGAGCTTVVGTSDFYVVSGGGGSGAGSEGGGGDGAGGSGTDCADGEFSLTINCPTNAKADCELKPSMGKAQQVDQNASVTACVQAPVSFEVDCPEDYIIEGTGCDDDACVVQGPGPKTVTVSCVVDPAT